MTLLAHGIGVRGDLPLPLWMVSYGAGFVLLLSFVALAVLWPRPRFEGDVSGMGVAFLALPARDRAVAEFDGRQATRSQYALLVVMVAYTIGGLVLLLG